MKRWKLTVYRREVLVYHGRFSRFCDARRFRDALRGIFSSSEDYHILPIYKPGKI